MSEKKTIIEDFCIERFEKDLEAYFKTLKLSITYEQWKTVIITFLIELLNYGLHFLSELGLGVEIYDTIAKEIVEGEYKMRAFNELLNIIKRMGKSG